MNGANFGTVKGSKGYEPTISSYDYDSPIDEAGRLAPKFALYRDVIRKHLAPGETLPDPPAPLPVIEVPRVELTETAPLLSLIGEPVASPRPLKFEELGQSYGFVLYRTAGRAAKDAKLEITEPRDFALVLQGGRRIAVIDRHEGQTSATVTLSADEPLDILVLNDGRINFGPKLYEDRKGITEKVTLDGAVLEAWQMYRLPCDDLSGLRFSAAPPRGPSFFRGRFELAKTGDTYIDTRGWAKGNVWVNGHNLGRHWKIGPQQTLFCPGVWLRKGPNEIVVLDLYDGSPTRSVAGVTNPVWETHW
jgi:beta-galactosidase